MSHFTTFASDNWTLIPPKTKSSKNFLGTKNHQKSLRHHVIILALKFKLLQFQENLIIKTNPQKTLNYQKIGKNSAKLLQKMIIFLIFSTLWPAIKCILSTALAPQTPMFIIRLLKTQCSNIDKWQKSPNLDPLSQTFRKYRRKGEGGSCSGCWWARAVHDCCVYWCALRLRGHCGYF